MPRSLRGSVLRLALAGAAAVVAVAGYATFRIWQQGQTDEQGRPADAIVVLGAAHYGDTPSPVFAARLDHAVELWLGGIAPYLIVTGGEAAGDTSAEADVARRYAEDRGVPAAAILEERTGRDTAESLRHVAAILRTHRLHSALFVSDRTHMLRVLRVAADLGIQAYGSPTATSPADLDPSARVASTVHELGALALYLVTGR
ncbi:MAG TPA: YdcF family protein [Candidatus Acidoferrales bacterium]|nr:YdcF family protein [Candidatus Acidoferrales bacterium]